MAQTKRGIISGLYKGLISMKAHSTLYIKTQWEMEGGIDLTEEEWVTIYRALKVTPRLAGETGNTNANHYHVFWDCRVIKTYWKGIHNAIQEIYGSHLPLESKALFFGWPKKDKYLFNILLVAGK